MLAALAKRDQAALDLKNTEVHAPADGVVSQSDRMQVGQYVSPGDRRDEPGRDRIELGRGELQGDRPDQDARPARRRRSPSTPIPATRSTAEVASVGAGTGSEFSLLPAQNATGNWVKVVQRVPVRIRFTDDDPAAPLRTGLSAYVSVDTESTPAKTAAN